MSGCRKGSNMAAPRKDDVKNIILDAAARLMRAQGLYDVSLARIAREAGVSKGTLYYHFKTKEDILFGLTDRYLSKQWDDLVRWTEDPSKDTSLHRLVKYVAQRNVASEDIRIHLIYSAMLGNDEIRRKLIARYEEFARLISAKIAQRTQAVDASYLTWLILLASDGLIVQRVLGNGQLDADGFLNDSARLLKSLE